jgi:hypothetical protein
LHIGDLKNLVWVCIVKKVEKVGKGKVDSEGKGKERQKVGAKVERKQRC